MTIVVASRRRLACSVIVAVLAGCGGSSDSASVPSAPPPPPLPPPAPIAPQASARPRPKEAEPQKPKRREVDDADLPNVYVVGERAPNYIAQRAPLRLGQAAYTALKPGGGVDSSQFAGRPTVDPRTATQPHGGFDLPEGFNLVESGGFNEQGIPLRIRCEQDGTLMAFVPGGGFIQGADGRAPEASPAHVAYVDGFYIDTLEVTVAQYERFRTDTLTTRRPEKVLNEFDPPDYPALGVSWRDAGNYARWAGKELPTEAEWEKAGRGVDGLDFPWGNGRAIWKEYRQPGQIDPVGTFPNDRSIYGVLDLAGSAKEWCQDWYAPDTYVQTQTPDGSPRRNPTGIDRASPPNTRVVKGAGSDGWQLWARSGVSMREQRPEIGLRCVLRVELPEDVKEADAQRAAPRGF